MSSIEQQALSQVLPEAQNQSRTIRSIAPSATNSGVYKSASNASNLQFSSAAASQAASQAASRKSSIHSAAYEPAAAASSSASSYSNSRKPSQNASYIANQTFESMHSASAVSRKPSQASLARKDSALAYGSAEVSNRIALDLIELLRANSATISTSALTQQHASSQALTDRHG